MTTIMIKGSNAENPSGMQRAAKEVGALLAKEGYTLIIGSDNPTTADAWVLQGVKDHCTADPKNKATVKVYRPTGGLHNGGLPSNLLYEIKGFGSWIEAGNKGVEEADMLLIFGGHTLTDTAAKRAKELGKPIVALTSFGGAGANYPPSKASALTKVWEDGSAKKVVAIIKTRLKPKASKEPLEVSVVDKKDAAGKVVGADVMVKDGEGAPQKAFEIKGSEIPDTEPKKPARKTTPRKKVAKKRVVKRKAPKKSGS